MTRPRSRKAMIEFLRGHFRYDTMNSWNCATSYAVDVKVDRQGWPHETVMRALDLLGVHAAMVEPNAILAEFDRRWNWRWQHGFNGRSGGYVVLYEGGLKSDGYKRLCRDCGQGNYRADAQVCGRCRGIDMVDYTAPQPYCYPGRGVDMDADYEGWDTFDLRQRVEVVLDFDRTVAAAMAAFRRFCEEHEATDEEVLVPTTIRVAVKRRRA